MNGEEVLFSRSYLWEGGRGNVGRKWITKFCNNGKISCTVSCVDAITNSLSQTKRLNKLELVITRKGFPWTLKHQWQRKKFYNVDCRLTSAMQRTTWFSSPASSTPSRGGCTRLSSTRTTACTSGITSIWKESQENLLNWKTNWNRNRKDRKTGRWGQL